MAFSPKASMHQHANIRNVMALVDQTRRGHKLLCLIGSKDRGVVDADFAGLLFFQGTPTVHRG